MAHDDADSTMGTVEGNTVVRDAELGLALKVVDGDEEGIAKDILLGSDRIAPSLGSRWAWQMAMQTGHWVQ